MAKQYFRGCFAAIVSIFLAGSLFPFRTTAETPFILGAWYHASDLEGQTLEQFEQSLGVFFNAHKRYIDWNVPLDTTFAQTVHAQGRIPEITWQPMVGSTGIRFGDIASGLHDTYINQFAQSAKSLNFPIQITLAAEMNGLWSPWAINGQLGRTNTDFINGWRRIVTLFQQAGVQNVSWVWSPNVAEPGGPEVYSFAELYPGDAYVTYMGLDGYNFGTYFVPDGWRTFKQVFQHSYTELTKLSNKSILLMEVGSVEQGGDKAQWIRDMFTELPNFPRIRGFTWFNRILINDYRIASTPASRQAFKEGAAAFFGTSSGGGTGSSSESAGGTTTGGGNTSSGSSNSQAPVTQKTATPTPTPQATATPEVQPTAPPGLVAIDQAGKPAHPVPTVPEITTPEGENWLAILSLLLKDPLAALAGASVLLSVLGIVVLKMHPRFHLNLK